MLSISNSWSSYPSIFSLGHKALERLFDGPVIVEEKIDGSQFSFGLIDGTIRVRSKGQEFPLDAPPDMFKKACETVEKISGLLTPNWTYRSEYVSKPKHNSLTYSRPPENYLIIFDINDGHESYLPWLDKCKEAGRIGLECVPLITNDLSYSLNTEFFLSLLERESILGGTKIEGFVVKNYTQFGQDKKVLMGKFVSEMFKEIHGKEWGKSNPTQGDVVSIIIEKLRTNARWEKAIQHLRETGKLQNALQDIGPLMKEVPEDILKECTDLIKDKLFGHFWPHIKRGVVHGLPEYYKEKLLSQQFEVKPEHDNMWIAETKMLAEWEEEGGQ